MENIRISEDDGIIVHLTPDQGDAVANAVEKYLAMRAIFEVFGEGPDDLILQDFVNELEVAINFHRDR